MRKKTAAIFTGLILLASALTWGCRKDYPLMKISGATPYQLVIPKGFSSNPLDMNLRTDNPMTVEGVDLGRRLFYDKKLSGNNTQSCSSCHMQEYAFSNGPAFSTSKGSGGIFTPRNAPAIFNSLWAREFMWDGGQPGLEEQTLGPITNPIEMNQDLVQLRVELQNDPNYPYLFKKAFGSDSITIGLVQKALAQFERTIISGNSDYDKWRQGKKQLSADEIAGMNLFNDQQKGDCTHCHTLGGTFTNFDYKNNGLDTAIAGSTIDIGKYKISHIPSDSMKFKTPTLRNIALTAPYMHDGRISTLDSVIEFYDHGYHRNKNLDVNMALLPKNRLTPTEKRQIVAFLKTLTDKDLVSNPAYSEPK
jgi:cytochrome c peroxidase